MSELPEKYLAYSLPEQGYLIISLKALSILEKHAQHNLLLSEAGGILIGKVRPPHIEITHATEPSHKDYQTRFQFIRRGLHHIQETVCRWKESQYTETYIGEWHTHPQDNPTPSPIDISSWRSKLSGNNRREIMIIVGRNKHWVGLWDGHEATTLQRIIN